MVSSLRYFLVVLLVLLQIAAPLVHAHVGEAVPAGNGGLHLHEFETLAVARQQPMSVSRLDHSAALQSAVIVDIGSAIATGKNLAGPDSPLFDHAVVLAAAVNRAQPFVGFAAFRNFTASDHLLDSHPSRAPPR